MIQARVKLSEKTNQVLNIVKAKYNLKDKSAAIDFVVAQYEEKILEPQKESNIKDFDKWLDKKLVEDKEILDALGKK